MSAARVWTALFTPALIWYVHQQSLAGPLRIDCHVAEGWLALVWGAASLLLCAANAALIWPVARGSRDMTDPMIAWLARLAIAASAVFGLAIAFGSIASALVPPCAR